MKNKIIYLMAGVLLSGFTALAQDITTEDAVVDTDALKPKAGDFGIGISAMPYLDYLGNFFGKQNDNDLNLGGNTLYGKYFLSDVSAIRVAVYINNSTSNNKFYSEDDAALAADPTSTAQVIDTRKRKNTNMSLNIGYEMREDYNRFTFLYGAFVGYDFNRFQTDYTYGNPISALNPSPSSNNGGDAGGLGRRLSIDGGSNQSVYAGLFAGVEYFVAKRFAVGADFSLAYRYSWDSQEDTAYEAWDGTQVYEFDRPSSPGNTSSSLSTRQYSSPTAAGEIYVHFYF